MSSPVLFDRGNLYVADSGSGNIYRYTADATRTLFVSGLNHPVGLAFDGVSLTVAEQDGDQL
ncbi:MAG: hypothetical protein ABI233_03050, partial [Chthoniobacterales bacterium]